jgi:hypothetical protein
MISGFHCKKDKFDIDERRQFREVPRNFIMSYYLLLILNKLTKKTEE